MPKWLAFALASSILLTASLPGSAFAQLVAIPGVLEGEQVKHLNNIFKEIETTPTGKAGALVPALLESLSGMEKRGMYEVYNQLRTVVTDPSVVHALVAALKTDKSPLAAALLNQSKQHGADFDLSETEIKEIIVALGSEDAEQRKNLAQLLGMQMPASDIGVHGALIRLMTSDPQSQVRMQAAQSLGNIGREAYFKNTIPIAEAYGKVMLSDPSPQVRSAAASGLSQMGEKAAPAAASLNAALRDNSSQVRYQVLQTIIHLGPRADACLDELVDMFNGPKDNYHSVNKERILQAFCAIGPDCADKVLPLIIPLIKPRQNENTADGYHRQNNEGVAACRAVAVFGPKAVAAVPALTKMLDSPYFGDRDAAAKALGALGPDAKTAVAALKKAANDERHAEQSGHHPSYVDNAKQAARDAIFKISGEKIPTPTPGRDS